MIGWPAAHAHHQSDNVHTRQNNITRVSLTRLDLCVNDRFSAVVTMTSCFHDRLTDKHDSRVRYMSLRRIHFRKHVPPALRCHGSVSDSSESVISFEKHSTSRRLPKRAGRRSASRRFPLIRRDFVRATDRQNLEIFISVEYQRYSSLKSPVRVPKFCKRNFSA